MMTMLTYCKKDPVVTDHNSEPHEEGVYNLEFGSFPAPQFTDNIPTMEGVKLGRMLFYEKMLSKDNSQSCASCHIQQFAFTDTAQFSIGVAGNPGKRQAMSVFNTAWHRNEFFWDGRAHLLRDQSLMPIQDELEMNETLENVIAKLSASDVYPHEFEHVFGTEEITSERMSLAMEQFMNTIISNRSKYDKYQAGEVTLTASEERGRELFFMEYNEFFPESSGADCAHCHSGFNFTNDRYMNNGLDFDADQEKDLGRQMATENANDRAKFKVPSLRNIALTAPYMHDGRFKTLEEVIEHYDNDIHKSQTLDPALLATTSTGLLLTAQDKADLIAFLNTLTDEELIKDERFSDPF